MEKNDKQIETSEEKKINKSEKLEWETPKVTRINISSTEGEFNFLADANQLT